jgi:hypothetical protein
VSSYPIDEEASVSVSNDCDLSWDLYLLPPDHGADVGEWLEEVANEGHDESEARRHAEAVLARRPEFQLGGPYGADYQLTLPESFGLPVDVGFYGNHASISVAYWDLGERTIELGDIVSDIAEALTAVTGWVAYDPQEDRIVGRDELRRLFSAEHAHGVGLIEGLGLAADQPEKPPEKKRRFRLF